jgi:hypothetical protein
VSFSSSAVSAAGVTHFWSSWGGFGARSESQTTVVER